MLATRHVADWNCATVVLGMDKAHSKALLVSVAIDAILMAIWCFIKRDFCGRQNGSRERGDGQAGDPRFDLAAWPCLGARRCPRQLARPFPVP
jgi:hypothetical protein